MTARIRQQAGSHRSEERHRSSRRRASEPACPRGAWVRSKVRAIMQSCFCRRRRSVACPAIYRAAVAKSDDAVCLIRRSVSHRPDVHHRSGRRRASEPACPRGAWVRSKVRAIMQACFCRRRKSVACPAIYRAAVAKSERAVYLIRRSVSHRPDVHHRSGRPRASEPACPRGAWVRSKVRAIMQSCFCRRRRSVACPAIYRAAVAKSDHAVCLIRRRVSHRPDVQPQIR
jgi:predicted DNA-binding transcriptional regulator AlpA